MIKLIIVGLVSMAIGCFLGEVTIKKWEKRDRQRAEDFKKWVREGNPEEETE